VRDLSLVTAYQSTGDLEAEAKALAGRLGGKERIEDA
jgi:hypothetical protein